MIFVQLRTYEADYTKSVLYANGLLVGEVLEDPGRPTGVKIYGKTCIPEGTYRAKITYSPKFKRETVQLYNRGSDLAVVDGPISYTGIRVHSGVTVDHTDGCLLVGVNVNSGKLTPDTKLVQELEDMVRGDQECLWVIVRALQ